jgi:hypothetical protein
VAHREAYGSFFTWRNTAFFAFFAIFFAILDGKNSVFFRIVFFRVVRAALAVRESAGTGRTAECLGGSIEGVAWETRL